MRVEIKPTRLSGTVQAPPSKSMAHRLLICAGLSAGESAVRNLAFSDDVEATVRCLTALGADVRIEGDTAYVRGTDVRKKLGKSAILPCNACGSTLRFFAPLCMLSGEERILEGTEYLMSRPMTVYEDIAMRQGISFARSAGSIAVQGHLRSGVYEVPGDISSQFISGLLFALPMLEGNSEIHILPPVESRPYIDMTVAALEKFGVSISRDGDIYRISGRQRYHSADVTVEGDYSNAAFFEALNILDSDIAVQGLDDASLQGDKIYKILFEKIKHGEGETDISDCPDLGPILFAAAAYCGDMTFTGTRRLKLKESDRAEAMRRELMKFGVPADVYENSVTVHGGCLHAPTEALDGHGDHRIVMSLAVLATVTGGVIDGAEAVGKSFPDFFDRLRDLGAEVTIWNG